MYVVAGVSGRTGAVVADALLAAGKPVRVLVRDEGKAAPWRARGAEQVVASLDDPRGLARALAGAAGAYLLSPQDLRSADPISDGWRIGDAIARAVEGSGLPHLVLLSSLGAQHAEGTGLVSTLRAAEERLANTPAAVTCLRAACFLDNWAAVLGAAAGGKLPTFIPSEQVMAFVATRDIGAVAARALLEGPPAGGREVIELHGPRDWSPRQLAAVLARLLGHAVEPEFVPLDAIVPFFTGMGATPGFAAQVRGLYQGIAAGKVAGQGNGVRTLRGSIDAETAFRGFMEAARAA